MFIVRNSVKRYKLFIPFIQTQTYIKGWQERKKGACVGGDRDTAGRKFFNFSGSSQCNCKGDENHRGLK